MSDKELGTAGDPRAPRFRQATELKIHAVLKPVRPTAKSVHDGTAVRSSVKLYLETDYQRVQYAQTPDRRAKDIR